jgi:peptidoglycan hydrolase-like protein with peptidoglycan-binding domain
MTEIGMLMTGNLSTQIASLPKLPEQRPFQQENGVHLLSQLVPANHITPPEFIQIEGNSPANLSAKVFAKNQKKYRVADAQNFPSTSKDTARLVIRSQSFSGQSLPRLSFGSSGVSVRVLQRLLISNGYGMRVDGVFGPLTETAVKAFQNRRNLGVDGVVGQRTWGELTI